MFKQKTCLVLGAGTGVDYGFPTNKDLKGAIQDILQKDPPPYPFTNNETRDFLRALSNSGDVSIDEWLRLNPRWTRFGKTCIARAIGEKEVLDELKGGWMEALANLLVDGTTGGPEGVLKNKICFVSFNYDRCLEAFLAKRISEILNVPFDKFNPIAKKFFERKVVHIHGLLGSLPWQTSNPSARPYHKLTHWGIADQISKSMALWHESEDNDHSEAAVNFIYNSTHVHFLGFGFRDENLEKIAVDPSPISEGVVRELHGLDFGDLRGEIGRRLQTNNNPFQLPFKLHKEERISEYIRKHVDQ